MAGRTPVGRGRYRTGRNPDAARQHRPARDGLPLRIGLGGALTWGSPGPLRFRTRRYTCGSETLMKTAFRPLALAACAAGPLAQRPCPQLTVPSVREAAGNFRTPPREYGAIHWAIWGNELTQARIVSEFDQLVANDPYVVNLGPARGMTPKYLSPDHLALTKFAVEEARKRGMK